MRPGLPTAPISTVRGATSFRADGLPETVQYVVDDIEIGARVLGLSVVPLPGPGGERATLARGVCAYGGGEVGWSSWLHPG
jgi:hypothetical protein